MRRGPNAEDYDSIDDYQDACDDYADQAYEDMRDRQMEASIEEDDRLRSEIASFGIVPFDQIVMIVKGSDQYRIEDKSLRDVLEDLKNGYSPVPF